MKSLNNTITELFYKMIGAWDHITSLGLNSINYDNHTAICIKLNSILTDNKDLSLDYFIKDIWTSRVKSSDTTAPIRFTITTPVRTYSVPDIKDRVEYAKVLNTIEESLRKFEQKKLSEYITYFNDEKSDDLDL